MPPSSRVVPSYTAGVLQRCFVHKLQGVVTTGAKHGRYEFFDDEGVLVALTVLSQSWRSSTAISARMSSVIQREMRLQGQFRIFDDLVRCPCTRERWLETIHQS